ncbi:NAD-dependent epimerase/dehydratase family protein [Xanthobacter versatilis]|uniref:NAD-dependent epimerase/dehydratase family protein n=1 Tax=Xanthobacter autotrophicus (strain ATCC BAA-1158 / Py2) TaxID=78245 RepID=UPI00372B9F76
MKVLVTGGTGFIAAWIVRRLLRRSVAVRVLDIASDSAAVRDILGDLAREVDWRLADIRDTDAVHAAARGCGGIVHMAGILTPACRSDPVKGAQINLIGTLNAFEAARREGMPRVVYASSAGVFGPRDGHIPCPTTHYGAFKLACEGSARAYWEDHRIASIGFRPFIVYGPGRGEEGASAGPTLACRAAAQGAPYVIPYVGSTGMIYVDDVAVAFEQALFAPLTGAHAFNLAGRPATVDEVIAAIRRQVPDARITATGAPMPIAGELAPDHLSSVLPDLPETSLDTGIAATIAYYRGRAAARA